MGLDFAGHPVSFLHRPPGWEQFLEQWGNITDFLESELRGDLFEFGRGGPAVVATKRSDILSLRVADMSQPLSARSWAASRPAFQTKPSPGLALNARYQHDSTSSSRPASCIVCAILATNHGSLTRTRTMSIVPIASSYRPRLRRASTRRNLTLYQPSASRPAVARASSTPSINTPQFCSSSSALVCR